MLSESSKLWKERSKLTRWLEERRLVESRRPVLCVGGKEKWFARRDGCTEKVPAASLGECMRRPPRPSTCTMRITVAALVTRCVYYPLFLRLEKTLYLIHSSTICIKVQVEMVVFGITYRLTVKNIPFTVCAP